MSSNVAEPRDFDVIVLGLGTMGTATCLELARRGALVLGLDQFDVPHERGSHSGQTRIIRKSYFEHPDYVPLLQRAYENWQTLERLTSTELYVRTGLLYVGPPDHRLITGVLESSQLHGVPVETLDATAFARRFPALAAPRGFACAFEADAGFLLAERAIERMLETARRSGTQLLTRQPVVGWNCEGGRVHVQTSRGCFSAQKLVITAGAWAGRLIPELSNKLTVSRQVLGWFEPKDRPALALGSMPCWTVACPKSPGIFYGFPVLPVERYGEPTGFKVAHHAAGRPVTDVDVADPPGDRADEQKLREFVDEYFPGMCGPLNIMKTCRYTNTSDEHFLVDFVPGYDQRVVVAAGFSGHGFKFASVIAEALSDLALESRTGLPIDFLSLGRRGLH
jgi:sarcosine oxidase